MKQCRVLNLREVKIASCGITSQPDLNYGTLVEVGRSRKKSVPEKLISD